MPAVISVPAVTTFPASAASALAAARSLSRTLLAGAHVKNPPGGGFRAAWHRSALSRGRRSNPTPIPQRGHYAGPSALVQIADYSC